MSEASPRVSVVVPCRNRAEYLRATVDSVLAQGPIVECIVIDAASTDETVEILKSYSERVRWVSEPDGGHADAINKGWRMARGDVLAWLNADDVYEPGGVAKALAFLDAHPEVEVAYGECGAIDAAGRQVGYSYLRPWDLTYAVLHCDNCIPQPSAFIRRRALERVGMLDVAFHQKKDHELWLRVAAKCGPGSIRQFFGLVAHARNIRGLSFDAKTAAPACVQLTRHYFDELAPGQGEDAKPQAVGETREEMRRRAMSNAHLRAVDYARAGRGGAGLTARHLWGALACDATNWRAVWAKARGRRGGAKPQASPGAGRDAVEAAWLAARVGDGTGEALVVEPVSSDLGLQVAARGWRTLVVTPVHHGWRYQHPRLRLLRETCERFEAPAGTFDVVLVRDAAAGQLQHVSDMLRPGGVLAWTAGAREGAECEAYWTRDDLGRCVVAGAGGERCGGVIRR